MKFTPIVFFTFLLLLATDLQPVSSASSAILAGKLPVANSEFSLLQKERIGNLRIGLSAEKIKRTINCTPKRGPENLWAADGAYHQEWQYRNCGITLGMVSDRKGGRKSIESITLTSPSYLSTKRGIRIGSSERAVKKAYKAEWNRENSKSEFFVAGSIYGGLIFQFQNGKVSRIFLGAAAE
jgi:hypothetical protein